MIEVEVVDTAWEKAVPNFDTLATDAARTVALRVLPWGDPDIVILLTCDAAVQDLNLRFRDKDAPTNVLSFPAADAAHPHLGDIALAYGVCAREASEQGKSLAHHLQHLVTHGVLHLLGYDHATDADAEVMENLERDILAGLDVPDPYLWAAGG